MPENIVERLILADGTVLDNCSCGYYGEDIIWCFLKDISFAEAFQYFNSLENLNPLIYEIEEPSSYNRYTYTGIEKITSVEQRKERVNVRLEGQNIHEATERIPKRGEETDGTIHNPDQNQS